jgi:hypothetical protein
LRTPDREYLTARSAQNLQDAMTYAASPNIPIESC